MPRNIERDKREADRRKNQLIEAGFRLFSQNGIETVSLQKVADAANVSPATMYKYFLTKEKLLMQPSILGSRATLGAARLRNAALIIPDKHFGNSPQGRQFLAVCLTR